MSQRLSIDAYRRFPVDALPEPAQEFVKAGARAIGCDSSYIALPLLATLAASIGATRRVELKRGWTEPSVLWGVIIGRSGTAKSPAWLLATGILQRFQEWKLEEYPELARQYEQDMMLYAADVAEWKKSGRKKGEPPPEKPEEPQPTRYVVSDITVEALADRLKYSPRGLLVTTDEAGAWLGSFDAYRNGRGGDLPKWLSMYRAEGLLVDRKSSGPVLAKRAAVSVTGTITPGDFTQAMRGEHCHNGLLARLLVAAPPAKEKRWTDATVAPELQKRLERVYARLLALEFAPDENDRPAPVDVRLDGEAFERWVTFYNAHATRQVEAGDVLSSTLAKLEGTAARLALVHHLVRQAAGDEAVGERIDARSMAAGIDLVEWFAAEAERVYGLFRESDSDREQRELAELIGRLGGKVTAHDVRHRGFRGDSDAAEASLNNLVQRGYGQWEHLPAGPQGGRPTRLFVLNETQNTETRNPENSGKNGGFGFGADGEEPKTGDDDWGEV